LEAFFIICGDSLSAAVSRTLDRAVEVGSADVLSFWGIGTKDDAFKLLGLCFVG
jgi:hypothetical protein